VFPNLLFLKKVARPYSTATILYLIERSINKNKLVLKQKLEDG
tara:strand:+ start:8435 stop:8563 length:129 start_codon:yes stop_codon:yes gene_type:complete